VPRFIRNSSRRSKTAAIFVTDTSYPDVNPIFAHQLAQRQQAQLAQRQAGSQQAGVAASPAN
jgi:hypothetical protein